VVLVSGGLDSTVLWKLLARRGWEPTGLFIDYGQPAAEQERFAVNAVAVAASLTFEEVRIASVAATFPLNGPMLGRNLMLIASASSLLSPTRVVAIGLIATSRRYADASEAFARATSRLGQLGGNPTRLVAPLIRLQKQQVWNLGVRIQAPITMTYSCLKGTDHPCGDCDSCLERATVGVYSP
jgi:7-cyano-7-deazaguanine synthase